MSVTAKIFKEKHLSLAQDRAFKNSKKHLQIKKKKNLQHGKSQPVAFGFKYYGQITCIILCFCEILKNKWLNIFHFKKFLPFLFVIRIETASLVLKKYFLQKSNLQINLVL